MFKRLIALPALGLSAALALPVQAQDASTVVANVNGTDITVGHMIVAMQTLPQQYQQLPDEVLFQGILDQLIQQTVLQQSYDGDLPPRVTLSLENETRSLVAAEAIEVVLSESVSEEAVAEAYEAEYANQTPGKEYNASHILVETEDEAKAIIEELNNGADFAETAREKSTGPSGPSGGSLGWFGTGAMVAPFEEAVTALEVGAVSAPVQTQFGWHVIVLNDTRLTEVPSLEDVRGQIETEVRQKVVTDHVDDLVSAATVDRSGAEGVNAAVLRDLSLLQ